MYVCMCIHACGGRHKGLTCAMTYIRGQRITCGSRYSPSTVWVLGLKLILSVLVARTFLYLINHLPVQLLLLLPCNISETCIQIDK